MKTPTLIVRLTGLYLLVSNSIALFELHKVQVNNPMIQLGQVPVLGNFGVYAWGGVIVGLAATVFAGPIARILTFDSEPYEKQQSLADSLLGR